MKGILRYLKEFLKANFHKKLYLSVGAFLLVSLGINYGLDYGNKPNFEDAIIDPYYGKPIQILWFFLFQAFPFLVVCFFIYIYKINDTWLKSKEFWIKLVIGFSILAVDRSFYAHWSYLRDLPRIDYIFYGKLIRWSSSLVTSVLPLIFFYFIYEKHNKSVYGLGPKKWDLKPYAILLGITAVFIAIGSFLPDIRDYYPKYIRSYGDQFAIAHDINRWVAVLIYEISYGSDFISVELFFRGFLIMAFSRLLGENVVLAMAASYCFLHFGKPLGESVSSIFGGYILGIIALRTQHIWGGIMIHVGVAWLMEFFASLQRLR